MESSVAIVDKPLEIGANKLEGMIIMDVLETVILVLIISLPVVFLFTNRKNKQPLKFKDFQPIILELLVEMQQFVNTKGKSYEELEDLAITLLQKRIEDAKILSEDEMLLLNKEVLRNLIRPQLKKLYKK